MPSFHRAVAGRSDSFHRLRPGIRRAFSLDLEALASAKLVLHAAVYRRMIRDYGGGRPLPVTVRTWWMRRRAQAWGLLRPGGALVEAFRALLDLPLDP